MKFKVFLVLYFCLALMHVEDAQSQSSDRFINILNRMASSINSGDYEKIQQDFGKALLDVFPLDKSKPFFQKLTADCGAIKSSDQPRLSPPDQAVFPVHFERAVLDIKIVLDNQDKIIGLWFLPHQNDIPVPARNSVILRLPFEGKWLVLWGGDTKELNQHHDVQNQRCAFDFLMVDDSGRTYKGNGKENEDYFAFSQNILCPADGIVTDVISGVRDNAPGSMNPYSALGNAVFIEHSKNEVSVIAHFKEGSIRVRAGDKVKSGQVIGLCGNSGNSSEPHIHFHLQNTPVIQDGAGIKCQFGKVNIFGIGKREIKPDYSPVKGDIISEE
ncbi:MAG: peptidoglycan DD-metalloendopeptidase family protein [Bacteroidota bacterium]|jgi:hypothetical protein